MASMNVNDKIAYVPPKVWKFDTKQNASKMSGNRPTAGAQFENKLPVGKHSIQLYSLATPNGQKVTILLEELLQAGIQDAEYDAWLIDFIHTSDQFGSEFVDLNPNSKIPAMRVYDKEDPTAEPLKIFESGSILLYLADKFKMFMPEDPAKRVETLNWLFWQVGSAPYVGGGFGHFYAYANEKQQYPIDRFTMETKRQLDVLDKQLAKTNKFIIGDELTIADFAIFPWYGLLVLGKLYKNSEVFLDVKQDYPNVIRWAEEMYSRPACKRGGMVNTSQGLPERHDASDFDKAMEEKKEPI